MVELLVALLLALILMASFVSMMVDTLHNASQSAGQAKLIEETGAINQFLYTELRRAGYAASGNVASAPYNQVLVVGSAGNYSCVRFGYDSNRSGEKYFGFRVSNQVLQWFASSSSTGWTCDSTSTAWQAMHDASAIQVTSFSLNVYPSSSTLPASGVGFSYAVQTLLPTVGTEPSSVLSETHYVYPRNAPTVATSTN